MSNYDHTKDSVSEALGISSERTLEIVLKMKKVVNKTNTMSEALLGFINDPTLTPEERAWACFQTGAFQSASNGGSKQKGFLDTGSHIALAVPKRIKDEDVDINFDN